MDSSLPKRINFLIALFGVVGSLYFSEILKLQPCVLCWYQRILLYPMALIYLVALWTGDRGYQKYILPFLVLGIGVSGYHNLLYAGIIPAELSPCTQDLSCTTKQLELFGFLSIPLMSLGAFAFMFSLEVLSLLSKKVMHEK